MIELSIVVPCFNEEEALPLFYNECSKVIQGMNVSGYEMLFVDDGSKDQTLAVMKKLAATDAHVKYVSFTRNFGKEAAIYAGLKESRGNYVAVLDADMQDPPSLLPQMYAEITGGEYDSIAARRIDRKCESRTHGFLVHTFYKIINRISDVTLVDGARDFRLMSRRMVDSLLAMKEYFRFSKGLYEWAGYKTKWIEYEDVERVAGETKWNGWKLFRYAIDGIFNFSHSPLNISSAFGIVMTVISVVLLLVIVIRKLIFGDPVAGWASTVCIIVFIGGMQMFCMGIMGQYIAKTYIEVKHRPMYFIMESNTDSEDEKTGE